jgi:thiamine-monophosphate kinase
LQPFAVSIVGGDICRSPITTVAITAFGQVLPDRAIKRSSARPGDAILVTGVHGAARAGLELLLHPEQGESLPESERSTLITAHQRPRPRLDVVATLGSVIEEWQNKQVEPVKPSPLPLSPSPPFLPFPQIAGMDTSDGLADAVLQICRASNVGAQLEWHQIPLPAGITDWISLEQAIDWALYGGEDFELVLCLPLELAQRLVQRIEGAVIVGTITAGQEVVLSDRSGKHPSDTLRFDKGFQHF